VISFSKSRPRLTFLAIGIGLGILMVAFTSNLYNKEIKRIETVYERVQRSAESTIATLTQQTSKLREENRSLKQHTKIVDIKNVDGSTSRTYENDVESETEVKVAEYTSQISTLEHKMSQQSTEFKYKLDLLERSKPSASFSLGVTDELNPYFSGTYNFWGPFVFSGILIYNTEVGIGIGWQF